MATKPKQTYNFTIDPELMDKFREHSTRIKDPMSAIVSRHIERVVKGTDIDALSHQFRAPLLTKAPAGPWEEAIEHAGDFVISEDTADELEARDGDVFVRAIGDSMEGAGIQDGMLLLMRPLSNRASPRRGEIALVQIIDEDGEYLSTIKRWRSGSPPRLEDGEGEEYAIPENVREVIPVAVARGIIGRV